MINHTPPTKVAAAMQTMQTMHLFSIKLLNKSLIHLSSVQDQYLWAFVPLNELNVDWERYVRKAQPNWVLLIVVVGLYMMQDKCK